jgi:hypothetical protein
MEEATILAVELLGWLRNMLVWDKATKAGYYCQRWLFKVYRGNFITWNTIVLLGCIFVVGRM